MLLMDLDIVWNCLFALLQDLAMDTADQNNSTVILANDPDADRLALAEKLPR